MSAQLESVTEREFTSSRLFDASPQQVFEAWSDPDILARWWGPKGFTNTFQEFDLRPGGDWRFVMHGPDGTDYANHSVFIEVLRPQRIVFDHLSGPKFRVIATFKPQAGRTALGFCMLFESAEDCQQVKRYAAEANEQNFDRLAEELEKMQTRL